MNIPTPAASSAKPPCRLCIAALTVAPALAAAPVLHYRPRCRLTLAAAPFALPPWLLRRFCRCAGFALLPRCQLTLAAAPALPNHIPDSCFYSSATNASPILKPALM